MTAYELINELEQLNDDVYQNPLINQAVALLQKQQADLEHMWMANTTLEAEIEELQQQVTILKKDVEGWMDDAGQTPNEEYWERLFK